MSKSKFPVVFMIFLGLFILFGSAALAYANYFDIIPLEKTVTRLIAELPWNQEEEVVEVRPAAHPTPTPAPTEIPVVSRDEAAYERVAASNSFVPFTEKTYTYTRIENSNCMSRPGGGYVVQTFTSGMKVQAVGTDMDYLVVHCGDGSYGYAKLEDFGEGELYATLDNAIDLRAIMPDASYQMIWCFENNMIGRSLYPAIPILEETTALKLWAAAEDFLRLGYRMIIYDAYRPATAQSAIYEAVKDPGYVLNPWESYSWHNVGKAVDISLIDISTGEEVELPSPIYTFDTVSSRKMADQWTDEAKTNIELMTRVMESHGFSSIETEWWHFEIPEKSDVELDARMDYSSIVYEPAN